MLLIFLDKQRVGKMKILLVKPPLNRNMFSPAVGEPLELEYLASAVKEHDVEILDMRLDLNLVDKLEKFNPFFVGITGYTCDVNSSLNILKEVKKYNKNIVTAIGGHHATFMPYDCTKPYVDVIFFGMSDLSSLKLMTFLTMSILYFRRNSTGENFTVSLCVCMQKVILIEDISNLYGKMCFQN